VVSLLLQQLRPGCVLRGERNAEVGNPVNAGQESGKDGGVRRVGDWAVSERLREANAVGGEGIERWSFDLLVAVTGDVVGAQRVERDQEDIGQGFPRRGRLSPGRSQQENDARKVSRSPHEINLSQCFRRS